jgi:hypothetical protein
MKSLGAVLAAFLGLTLVAASPAAAGDTYDANALWAYEESVPLGERITIWECWKEGDGNNPRIDQRVGKKWKRLDVSTVTRDEEMCGKNQPIKATYKFKIRDSLRWNKKQKSYEAVVRTYCSGCVTYKWAILVDR